MWSAFSQKQSNLSAIILDFKGSDQTSLQKVELDIGPLLHMFPYNTTPLSIKTIRSMIYDDKTAIEEEHLASRDRLRRAVFLLFYDILRDMPDKAVVARQQICFNGSFNMLRAVFTATETQTKQTVGSDVLSLSDEEMRRLGHQKIRNLALLIEKDARTEFPAFDQFAPCFQNYYLSSDEFDHLASTWAALRNSLWSDW